MSLIILVVQTEHIAAIYGFINQSFFIAAKRWAHVTY